MAERVVRRYLQARTFREEGSTIRKLEEAYFANGNGFLGLTLYESASVSRGPDAKVYKSYGMLSSVGHFSLITETDIPLGSAAVVEWLKGALSRIEPLVTENQSSWDADFAGKAEIKWLNGQEIPDPPVDTATQAESAG